MSSNQGDISGSDFLPWEMTELHWTASQPWCGQASTVSAHVQQQERTCPDHLRNIRHTKLAGLDKETGLPPTRWTKGQLSASSSTLQKQMHESGTPSATGAGEGGLPGPHAHLCSPSATTVGLQRLGDLSAGWPWAATRLECLPVAYPAWRQERTACASLWRLPLLAQRVVTGRARQAQLQARKESRNSGCIPVRETPSTQCSDPLLGPPCGRVTSSPLC